MAHKACTTYEKETKEINKITLDTKPHWDSFDAIKGLACIAVVFIHVLFPEPLKMTVKSMARFGVPIFFMTSGFFFAAQDGTYSADSTTKKRGIFLC